MKRMITLAALALFLGLIQPAAANCGIGYGQQGQGQGCSDDDRENEGSRELPAHDMGWMTLAALVLAGGAVAVQRKGRL